MPYQPKIQSRYPEIQTLRNLLQGVTSENSGNNYLGVEIEAVDGGSEDDSEEGIDEHDIDLFMVQVLLSLGTLLRAEFNDITIFRRIPIQVGRLPSNISRSTMEVLSTPVCVVALLSSLPIASRFD